jgi:hypothetical protein
MFGCIYVNLFYLILITLRFTILQSGYGNLSNKLLVRIIDCKFINYFT